MVRLDGRAMKLVQKRPSEGASIVNVCSLIVKANYIFFQETSYADYKFLDCILIVLIFGTNDSHCDLDT